MAASAGEDSNKVPTRCLLRNLIRTVPMKTVAALSLLASASAFAPASTGSRVRVLLSVRRFWFTSGGRRNDHRRRMLGDGSRSADAAASLCMYEDLPSRYQDIAMYPSGVERCGKHMHEMRLPSIWKTRHKLRYRCFPVQYLRESARASYVVADGGNQI